jgi:hypothetical protein
MEAHHRDPAPRLSRTPLHAIELPHRPASVSINRSNHLFGTKHGFMNAKQESQIEDAVTPEPRTVVADELTRVKLFLGIQAFFLGVSVFTGGFNFKLWSMLDTALMIQSIGVTALVVVLEESSHRRLAFKVAIVLYLLAILDMGINVCVSGVVGWKA